MKNHLFLFILLSFISCQKTVTIDYVIEKFNDTANSYKNIETKVTRIDTFYDGYVMNRNGTLLIEKDINDELFGLSFYAIPNAINKEYLYDNNKAFQISKELKNYTLEKGYRGFLGSPGGQLFSKNLISLDSIYESIDFTETKNSFILKYSYEDDTVYNVSNHKKIVLINKSTFLPSKVITTSERLGEKSSQHYIFENIKIDDEINTSIEKYKNELQEYTIEQTEDLKRNSQIGKKFIENELFKLNSKPTLISFWEVWCSPSIRSISKFDNLKNKYSPSLNFIGIATENQEMVQKMLSAKKTSFLNLIANSELHKRYEINSFSTYFLIDKNGMILKEYFSFSDEIEKDIKDLILK